MGGDKIQDLFEKFQEEIRSDTIVADLAAGLIGHDLESVSYTHLTLPTIYSV